MENSEYEDAAWDLIKDNPGMKDQFWRKSTFIAPGADGSPRLIVTRSPVEAALLMAIFDAIPGDDWRETHHGNSDFGFRLYDAARRDCHLFLFIQYRVRSYQLDIAILGGDSEHLCVEVDGHEFHERTPEQAQRDKKRDRELQKDGWKVIRFTGSEVFRDARRCALEVLSFLGPLRSD